MLVFGVLFSGYAFAATKVSIDSVRLNGNDIAENKKNFIQDTNNLDIIVSLTALSSLSGIHVQAILTDTATGNTVSDSTGAFDLLSGQNSLSVLSLRLIDSLKRDKDFSLDIKVIDRDNSVLEKNTYGIRFTGGTRGRGTLDISLDRVRINGQIIAASQTNFIEKSNDFDVSVEFTALEDLNGAHIEAILKDLRTGTVVADATSNFNLASDVSATSLLSLALINGQRNSDSFELTIRIIDQDGNSIKQVYGIRMKQGAGFSSGGGLFGLDISVNRVLVNNQVVAASRTNFIDRSNDFDVVVEFTALEDLRNAHVEAVLRDLATDDSVADATSTFNLNDGSSTSFSLELALLDKLKQSNSFELTIKIIDEDGNSIQKVYGIAMREKGRVAGISGAGGRALDVSIDSVELEDKFLAENENNFVMLDKVKKELNVDVRLTALESIRNAHVDAVLAFENGNVVADATLTFDISNGQSVTKSFDIPVIGKFEQNNFRLKISVVDAEGNAEEKSYGLTISQQKFPFVISSIALAPEDNIEAGKNLIARLSFKNSGVLPLEGITAKVSIPELGISSTKFIDQIKNNDLSEVKEDFVLRILDDAATGTYAVRAEIASQFGGDSEAKEIPVSVVGKNDQAIQVVNDKLVIKVPIVNQDVNDASEVTYPITLTNQGPGAKAYTMLLDGANWANLRLSESNTFVLKPKQSKTVNIYASSNGDARGEQAFLVTVKSEDNVLSQIPLKGNVTTGRSNFAATLANALVIVFIGIVVLLVLVGLFFGIRKYFQGETKGISEEIPDEAEGEAYY